VSAMQSSVKTTASSKDASDNHMEFSIKLVKPASPKEKGQRLAQVESKSEVDEAKPSKETVTEKT
jgi:hypothetical protein